MLQWHAHEMFYGFGWAALAGFLLTATKNWVGVRGWHGGALAFLVAAWLLDRAAMNLGAHWPSALFWVAHGLFQCTVVVMVLWTLLRYRDRDSFKDNHFFYIALPLFVPAKYLLVQGDHSLVGWSMTLALFRVAFLLMFERTLTQFMRGIFQVDILRDPRLDHSIKWLAIIAVFVELMPSHLAGSTEILLALLLLARFFFWHPGKAFSRLDIGIMYLGYLAITAQLLASGMGRFIDLAWTGTVTVHLFSVGAMGLILPAMIVRISKGHTGRPVVFDRGDRTVLWIMIAGLALRVVAPQVHPAGYTIWLALAAGCWFSAFGLLAWRYAPFLLTPRADGKEH